MKNNNDIDFYENKKNTVNNINSNRHCPLNNNDYKNIFLCPLNKNDCVNSIDIYDDIVLYGTIMGNVYFCRVNENNLYQNNNIPEIFSESENIEQVNPIENPIEPNSSKISVNNDSQNEIKNKEKDSSKLSCIKLNTNNSMNNSKNLNIINGNETLRTNNDNKKEKEIFVVERLETNKSAGDLKKQEISTKKRILNKIENKNIKSDESLIDKVSKIEKNNKVIPFPQVTQLILNATENVPCVSFDTKDKVNLSIGDYEIIRLENMTTFNINDNNSNYNYIRIRNYSSENEHIRNCENATCMMTDKYFLIVHTIFGDNNSTISLNKVNYENKMLTSFDVVKGEIEMFNFSIPFDFDNDRFLFVDYESETSRRICIYYTLSKCEPYIYKITNDFGHINYMKFLLNDKIILCKNQRYFEIHKLDENFGLLESWEHEGNEIISMNIYIEGSKDSEPIFNDSNTNLSFKKYYENESQTIEINIKKANIFKNKNKNHINNNIYEINSKNNIKRKPFEKEKFNNSTLRELKLIDNKNINKKNIKYDEYDRYFDSEIENRKNRFRNGDQIEIYNKNKTPNGSINEYKKKHPINKFINNDFLMSDKELIEKNKSFHHYIQDKNKATERSFYQNEKKIYIISVDLSGNCNLFHNNKRKTIFNLYKINNIDKKYKEEEFFSLGFPYYVTMNNKYIAISTDHGIFVLSKKIQI